MGLGDGAGDGDDVIGLSEGFMDGARVGDLLGTRVGVDEGLADGFRVCKSIILLSEQIFKIIT